MNAALKKLYLPRLQSTVNTATVLLSRVERVLAEKSVSGQSAIVPINIRPSEAIASLGDGDDLPTPQNQTLVESSVGYNYLYGTIRITHPTIAASRNEAGAWTKVISAEMEGLERDLRNDVNRQLFGWGSGSLGTTADANSGTDTTITMNTGHKVKANMVIDAWDNAAATDGESIEISGITVSSVSGNVVTLATAQTWDIGDHVFRKGSRGNEMMGLQGIIDDASKTSGIGAFCSTLQGISRSSYPEWNANVFENSTANAGRNVTDTLLDDSILEIEESGEGNLTCGITSRVQFRKIAQLMTPDRRYSDAMELNGGFKSISWGGIPIFWDSDCPVDVNGNDMLFWIDENELSIYQLADWNWDDEDGNVLHRNEGKATYDGTLYYYANMGTTAPDNMGVIRDLSRS
tara:strand:+ start:749 stop:1963 length:1215 start_codon:yes stop_codon:yes gene_type:complete